MYPYRFRLDKRFTAYIFYAANCFIIRSYTNIEIIVVQNTIHIKRDNHSDEHVNTLMHAHYIFRYDI